MSVHYNPYFDPTNGHPYVEIAGIKWATMNVGATSETDAGLYFAWGDTQGYTASQVGTDKQFTWADYKFNPSGDGTTMTKYNATDGLVQLDLEDDAAHVIMGGNWRMPTEAELTILLNNITNQETTVNGVKGRMFRSKTDITKELFFPKSYCSNSKINNDF